MACVCGFVIRNYSEIQALEIGQVFLKHPATLGIKT
jgi:hypothetical protein